MSAPPDNKNRSIVLYANIWKDDAPNYLGAGKLFKTKEEALEEKDRFPGLIEHAAVPVDVHPWAVNRPVVAYLTIWREGCLLKYFVESYSTKEEAEEFANRKAKDTCDDVFYAALPARLPK